MTDLAALEAAATPGRHLTVEEAIEKALLFTFQLSNMDYRKVQAALSEVAFVRALEQDGYTIAARNALPRLLRIEAAAREAIRDGDALVGVLSAAPADCDRQDDLCVMHNAEWSTRNGADLGHCEWIEARMVIVPNWQHTAAALRDAIEEKP